MRSSREFCKGKREKYQLQIDGAHWLLKDGHLKEEHVKHFSENKQLEKYEIKRLELRTNRRIERESSSKTYSS